MTLVTDPIRILLIDDNPVGFPRARGYDTAVPEMSYDYQGDFAFRWVATPGEAREMRDLSWRIEQRDPHLLDKEGWIPEILAIDYTLLQYEGAVQDRVRDARRLASISPLPALRQCASRLNINREQMSEFDLQPAAGTEYWGCFIGGLLMNSFATHPCAPVTITRYTQDTLRSQGLDAAFFEWMMDVQSSGLLHAAGDREDVAQNWDYVIRTGVRNLRTRLITLAKADIVQVLLDDLLALAEDAKHPVLTVLSRYGRRRYPVGGLFVDGTESPQEWADGLLRDIWKQAGESASQFRQTRHELTRGLELARRLWKAHCEIEAGGVFDCRQRLSQLRARAFGQLRVAPALTRTEEQRIWTLNQKSRLGDLVNEEETELASLNKKASLEPMRVQDWSDFDELHRRFGITDPSSEAPACDRDCVDLRDPAYVGEESWRARRWAVLLTVVHLLHLRWSAVQRAQKELEKNEEDDDFPGEYYVLTPKDVYLALFPIPRMPASLPWDNRRADPAGSWKALIDELDLDLKGLLAGQQCGGPTGGERHMMRLYAAGLGNDGSSWRESDWRADWRTSWVLYGRDL